MSTEPLRILQRELASTVAYTAALLQTAMAGDALALHQVERGIDDLKAKSVGLAMLAERAAREAQANERPGIERARAIGKERVGKQLDQSVNGAALRLAGKGEGHA